MNRIRKKTVGERKIRIMIVGESELVRAGLRKVIEDAGRNLVVMDDVELEQAPSLPLGFSRQGYSEVSLDYGIHVVAF